MAENPFLKSHECFRRSLCKTVHQVDARLLAFFAHPGPRRVAEKALRILERLEKIVFWPFALLAKPAEMLLAGIERKRERDRGKREGKGRG